MSDKPQNAKLRWLLVLPLAAYALSYVYLAVYHGHFALWNTVVHESGTYTLLQTIFYASHFLGHIPSLTVIALLFVGSDRTFQPASHALRMKPPVIAAALGVLLTASVIISLQVFGTEDTLAYIMQQRQGVGNDVSGGSWNLHLPSTVTLFVVLPLCIFVFRKMFGLPLVLGLHGIPYFALAALLIVAVTALVNRGSLSPLGWVWTDPRYVAHSVRELATYPLIFFPIPLYFIFKHAHEEPSRTKFSSGRSLTIFIAALLTVALPVMAYQIAMPLSLGIGTLAQKPAFAHGGQLSIPYLLTSHYFEHVLDTVYFTLLSLLLLGGAARLSETRIVQIRNLRSKTTP